MRYGLLFVVTLAGAVGGCAQWVGRAGSAGRTTATAASSSSTVAETSSSRATALAGVWDGIFQATIDEGMAAGDTRIERQEWHLAQAGGGTVSGYYVVALTMVSGDGRPYVCSRQPQFSSLQRFDVRGRVNAGKVDLEETAQRTAAGACSPARRPLSRYRGELRGDVLTLVAAGHRQTLYRRHGDAGDPAAVATRTIEPAAAAPPESPFPALTDGPSVAPRSTAVSSAPADVAGTWVWEHRGLAPGGDEKHEREEWHVTQEGTRLTGYYDRVVRQISTDGHAYRCSMALEFQVATRYRISGEVRGDDLVIHENTFEILEPSACDSGKRRLDSYLGRAGSDEIRLLWGVGSQVLRRARPDVPTQRF